MKLVKLTMLAATAAVAASAFIGAASASAVTSHPWIALCDAQQLLLCETSHLIKHPLKGRVLTTAGPGAFNAGFVTVECASGIGESNLVESQQLEQFLATLESLTFAACKGCKEARVETPQNVVLTMGTELENDWRLKTETTLYKVEFSGCPFGIVCFYEGELNFELQMNASGVFVEPKGREFNRGPGSGGLCAATGKWETGKTTLQWRLDDAKSSIHDSVWPTLLEKLTKVETTKEL